MSASAPPLLLLSGIGPGYTGVGRIVADLQTHPDVRVAWVRHKGRSLEQAAAGRDLKGLGREIAARAGTALGWVWRRGDREWTRHPRLVLLHPQTIGVSWTLALLRQRPMTDLFLVDASFFCRSSYNHRAGAACLECIGSHGEPARRFGCRRFPVRASAVDRLVVELPELAAAGRVRFFVQNEAQVALVRHHCGPAAAVAVVGLWADEWQQPPPSVPLAERAWDVVFHGADDPAKGSRWALRVAALCPGRRFLFPFRRPAAEAVPPNADCRPCTWATGLGAEVARAGLTLNPSQWSAPIEGALVKSLRWARAVAVAPALGSYASELPEALVLRLPHEPAAAAASLEQALRSNLTTDPERLDAWWQRLREGRDTVARMRDPIWLPRAAVSAAPP